MGQDHEHECGCHHKSKEESDGEKWISIREPLLASIPEPPKPKYKEQDALTTLIERIDGKIERQKKITWVSGLFFGAAVIITGIFAGLLLIKLRT